MDLLAMDRSGQALQKALDGLSVRQQAIANNIANIDTPHYKAIEVTFEEQLQAALRGGRVPGDLRLTLTSAAHLDGTSAPAISDVSPQAIALYQTTLRNDGNNVDIDREMARLAETQISFSGAVSLLNSKFQQLRMVIQGGR